MRCGAGLAVALTFLSLGCDGGGDSAIPSDLDVDVEDVVDIEVAVAVGCKDPDHWRCEPPSPGYEYGCIAVCGQRVGITCNGRYEGGKCAVEPTDKYCPIPTGQGCDICLEAVATTCADLIPE